MRRFNKDVYFIKKTFKLAKKAEGLTSPNPLVGAVIVRKGRVISTGYHRKAGRAHAEIEAIRKAGINLKGATLYVNLEPCFHYGRTPPCVGEIIKNKINKVVIAVTDPNPCIKGRSIRELKRAGLEVKVGVLKEEAERLNEVFFKNMRKRRPFVAAKVAQSLDGKIATKKRVSKWITSSGARRRAKSLRDKYDCILVGINTVILDNPRLNGLKKIPFKVIIDPRLKTPLDAYLLRHNHDKLIIFTAEKNKKQAEKFPCRNIFFLKERNGQFSLKEILNCLRKNGLTSVFVEGGSETIGRFFDQKLIDKIYFFISPKIIGGSAALTSVGGQGYGELKSVPVLKDITLKRLGREWLFSGYPVY